MTKGTGFSHLREIEEACYRVTTLPNIGGNFSCRSRFILPPRQKKYGVYIVSGNSSNSGNLIPQLAYFALLTRNSSNGESGNIRVIPVTEPVRQGLPWIARRLPAFAHPAAYHRSPTLAGPPRCRWASGGSARSTQGNQGRAPGSLCVFPPCRAESQPQRKTLLLRLALPAQKPCRAGSPKALETKTGQPGKTAAQKQMFLNKEKTDGTQRNSVS
jgi:hypothetical protein